MVRAPFFQFVWEFMCKSLIFRRFFRNRLKGARYLFFDSAPSTPETLDPAGKISINTRQTAREITLRAFVIPEKRGKRSAQFFALFKHFFMTEDFTARRYSLNSVTASSQTKKKSL